MQVDVLIVGQGLCGTHLSAALLKEGKTIAVIDDGRAASSSRVAAGIINPVTGRRYVTTWMIDELVEYALLCYKDLGNLLGETLLFQKNIIDFFPSAQMRNAFIDRLTENDTFLHAYPDQNRFNPFFTYDFGCGEVGPAYMVNVGALLYGWRKKLIALKALKEQPFILEDLKVEKEAVHYQNITAQKLVFCDGVWGAANPWFSLLPFSLNKGEALIIECENIPNDHIFKKGMMLAPLATENSFWVGSNYQWEFEDSQPSEAFYKTATTLLNGWLKCPYKVLDHKAAVRPATLERRPFVGFHPVQSNVGILNGAGTKGTSLAPFFAHQLAQHIVYGFPIAREADVQRFSKILSR